jgi:hypothetical protein
MIELVKTASRAPVGERVRTGERHIEVARLTITDAGREAVANPGGGLVILVGDRS